MISAAICRPLIFHKAVCRLIENPTRLRRGADNRVWDFFSPLPKQAVISGEAMAGRLLHLSDRCLTGRHPRGARSRIR
jgi:hypothetical protein